MNGINRNDSQPLTLKQLADYDDIATALTVDPWLGRQTHKMRKFPPNTKLWPKMKELVRHFRGHSCHDSTLDEFGKLIKQIPDWKNPDLLKTLKENCDPDDPDTLTEKYLKNERKALAVRFNHTCLTRENVKQLRQHIRKFLDVFKVDSGIEIVDCDRYSNDTDKYEIGAKIVATRRWNRGEVVHALHGVIASEKNEDDKNVIIPGVNDFSVTISTRTKENQLWLGPAAYINHDCNANTRLRATGTTKNSTAAYEITRVTESGEELLINYGNNFFGTGNANCQCRTCER